MLHAPIAGVVVVANDAFWCDASFINKLRYQR
jgi:hypothetical protein